MPTKRWIYRKSETFASNGFFFLERVEWWWVLMQSLLIVVFFWGTDVESLLNDISWFSAVDRSSSDRWFQEIFWEYMGWISKLEPQSTWEMIHWYLGNHGFEMTLDTLLSRFAPWAGPSRSRRGVQGEVSTKLRLGPRGFGFCSEPINFCVKNWCEEKHIPQKSSCSSQRTWEFSGFQSSHEFRLSCRSRTARLGIDQACPVL